MNLNGMGVKKISKLFKKDVADIPMLLDYKKVFNNIKVIDITKDTVTLKSMEN